jgi:GxxExxY protein
MASGQEHLNHISHRIIGAAIEVHKQLGPGFLESIYEEALAVEFYLQKLRFSRQTIVPLRYKGYAVGENRLDFLVEDQVIVELKAVESLLPIHTAQVISYLKATQVHLGLLINFNVNILTQGVKRIAL